LAILSCPGCSQKLRVPDNKRGTVACPLCGSEWFHPEVIELSSVEFRCSASGAKFNVISSRRSPLHKFTVQKIEKAVNAARSPEVGSSASSSVLNSDHAPPALVPTASRRGWLARIVGRKGDIATPKPMNGAPNDRPTPVAVSTTTTNDADEYNWSGFSCPYCEAPGFISCAGGHLACDGTAQTRKDGRFHQCFCGNAGFIVGTIKTFENERLSVEADTPNSSPGRREEQRGTPADIALPSPTRPVPAKR
jgi:hypothetical protein